MSAEPELLRIVRDGIFNQEGITELQVKAWPGCYRYYHAEDGKYHYNCGVLGGVGGGIASAYHIAERLWKDHRQRNPKGLLLELGWLDVLTWFEEFESSGCLRDKLCDDVWKQMPSGRCGRVRRSDLDAWISGGETPPSEVASGEDAWLTLAEAAARAAASKSTIGRWGNNGLKMKRHGRIVRIRSSVLDDYLKRRR